MAFLWASALTAAVMAAQWDLSDGSKDEVDRSDGCLSDRGRLDGLGHLDSPSDRLGELSRLEVLGRRSKLVRNFEKNRQELMNNLQAEASPTELSIQKIFEDFGIQYMLQLGEVSDNLV